VELRTRPLRAGELAERIELGLDRLPEPAAILALVLLERLDVGVERVTARGKVLHFALEPLPLVLRDAARGLLGFAHEVVGLALGLLEERARALLRLGDRLVGRLLREHERALEHLLGLAALAGASLRAREALGQLSHALGETFDSGGGAFEQFVDVVAVIATEPFSDVGVPQLTGSHIHGKPWYRDTRPKCETLRRPRMPTGRRRRLGR
jgi:hypothetical protein